jgi:2-amino-4-hydroxy-6-hydroxymethyldihydropteridine diphosphokinase
VAQRRVVVGLGSNLGDRHAWLDRALGALATDHALGLVGASPRYETRPVGGPPQGDYVNAAALLSTSLTAHAILERLLAIERALGRERSVPNAPRTLDLDVLWSEGESIATAQLVVPHPRLRERAFALRPLLDLAPDACDPAGAPYALLPAAREPLRRIDP